MIHCPSLTRGIAYFNARVAIIAALGWGYSLDWWLCKPDGDQ